MQKQFRMRLIEDSDAMAVLNIYKYYIENTAISFEYEAPTLEEYLNRIKNNTEKYPWLVCLSGEEIIGFAYGSTHRYRTAYQWSPETTIYLAPGYHSKGVGRILYQTLLNLLRCQGYFSVFAGVALPNEKSLKLHQSIGFQEIGIFKDVGYKLGVWHSTQWFQFNLTTPFSSPATPKLLNEVKESAGILEILVSANSNLNTIISK